MAREILNDEQVEQEIQALQGSPFVKLATKYDRIKNRRRQYLYWLRQREKDGKRLAEAGVTMERLNDPVFLETEFSEDGGGKAVDLSECSPVL